MSIKPPKNKIKLANKHKELLCFATSYLDIYVTDDDNIVDNDIQELYDFVRYKTAQSHYSLNGMYESTDIIASKVQLATAGSEMVVNVLAVATSCVMVLIEDNVFKGSELLRAKRLTNNIYNKIENYKDEAFLNAMKIIAKVTK